MNWILVQKVSGLIKAFSANQEGVVAILMALMMNIYVAVLALSIDGGKLYLTTAESQNAATAAALSSVIDDANGLGESDMTSEALDYFAVNFPTGQHAVEYDINSDVAVDIGASSVTVTPANMEFRAFFAPALGGSATATLRGGSVAEAGRPSGAAVPASLSLVLDVSGSMSEPIGQCSVFGGCKKITALKQAATKLIDNLAALPNAETDYSVAGVFWSTVVDASFSYQSDYTGVNTQIDSLEANGSTCMSCGLSRAKEFLPDSPQQKRVIVLMTDGEANTIDKVRNDGYPPGWTGMRQLAQPFKGVIWHCYEMKQLYPSDLVIWAITFGDYNDFSLESKQVMDYCASDSAHYIHAPDGNALAAVFDRVLQGIRNVRLVR